MALLAGGAAFAIYLLTLCPTVYVGDSGELTTASAVLGIAHPPGYPLYTLMGRLFALLPLGSVALRVNLMSAFFAAAAVGLVYGTTRRVLERESEGETARPATVAALATALLFAFSHLMWSESVTAEVYTFHLFWISLVLFCAARRSRPALLFAFAGLGAANHQTIVLMLPGLVYLLAAEGRLGRREAIGAAAAFAFSLTLYFFLLVRPSSPDLFAWRKPENLAALATHVFRGQYGDLSKVPRTLSLAAGQIAYLLRLLAREMTVGIVLVPVAFLLGRKARRSAWIRSLAIHFLLFSAGLLFLLNHRVDARDGAVAAVFYIPAVLFGLLLAAFPLHRAARRLERVTPRLSAALLLLPLIHLSLNYRVCDARRFRLAEEIGDAMLDATARDAVLLTEGDNNTFVLHYLQIVEGRRRDVLLLDRDLNLFSHRFTGRFGEPVTPETRDGALERWVASPERPVYTVGSFGDGRIAGKHAVSVGPIYRFLPDDRKPPASGIDLYHRGGFDGTGLRDDYMARRFAVAYLSRWADHYEATGNREGLAALRGPLLAAGKGLRETYRVLGGGIAAAGDTAAAVREMERAVDVDPTFLQGRRELAELLLANDEVERAVVEFRVVADEGGRPGDRVNLANALLVAGRQEEAAREYARALSAAEGDSAVLTAAAHGLGRLGRFGEEVRALEELKRAQGERFAQFEPLGDAYDKAGRPQAALEAYRAAARLEPGSARLLYKMGVALIRLSAPVVAESRLKRAVQIDPNLAGARNALAFLYARSGERLDEALSLVDGAIEKASGGEIGYYQDTRGTILSMLGREKEAEESFRLAWEGTPVADWSSRAETCRHMAALLEKREDTAGAARWSDRADSLDQEARRGGK